MLELKANVGKRNACCYTFQDWLLNWHPHYKLALHETANRKIGGTKTMWQLDIWWRATQFVTKITYGRGLTSWCNSNKSQPRWMFGLFLRGEQPQTRSSRYQSNKNTFHQSRKSTCVYLFPSLRHKREVIF